MLFFFCMAFGIIPLCNPLSQSLVPNLPFTELTRTFFSYTGYPGQIQPLLCENKLILTDLSINLQGVVISYWFILFDLV